MTELAQTASSVHPSSANSSARSGASSAAKNSSSCGGGTFGGAQHRVRLTPVMDLMLKQVKQQPIDSLALNAITAMDVHDTIKVGRAQALDDGNQSPVRLALRISEQDRSFARFPVRPGRRPQPAALHRVHVKAIDNQDMIERRAQARKETGPRRHQISLRQPHTGRQQTMVGPAVVVGHGTVGKDSIHQHLRSRIA